VTSGVFADAFSLTLSGSSDAQIHYTVDGSEPTTGSYLYNAPIFVNRSLDVRARAYQPNRVPSPVVGHVFLFLASDLRSFSSNLPIVLLDTRGHSVPGTNSGNYAEARSAFIDTDCRGRAATTDTTGYAGRAGLRIRGRSSTQFPKKQYKMETWDDANEDRDVELLGLPAGSDWVLYGPYSDKTLMRNYLAYRWWGTLGHYSVRTRFCEVFLNDDDDGAMSYADDYVGVYLLTEAIKIDENRVDIARLSPQDDEPPEVTGGYIIEMGNANAGGFSSNISGQTVQFSYWDPDAGRLTQAQKQWVRDFVGDFETALYGPQFADFGDGYAAYTDVDSQVDYEIMREFTRNFDGGSTYFCIDRNGKLVMGPLWDYNMAMGNVNYAHNDVPGCETAGWNDSYMAPGVNGWCPWWYRFKEDPDYQQRFIDRWFHLRAGLLSDARIKADVDAVAAFLAQEAVARNFERWPVLGNYVWANPPGWQDRRTYASEVDWMEQWLLDRAAWIDDQFVRPPRITFVDAPAGDGGVCVLTCEDRAGEIYYTLDGSDPRVFGGGNVSMQLLVSENAPKKILVPTGPVHEYWTGSGPFDDSRWSDGDYISGRSGGVGYDENSTYQPYISYDVGYLMNGAVHANANTTCYVRISFRVDAEDLAVLQSMNLSVRFDDAFVAYLNGTEIARSSNAPVAPAWNAAAVQTLSESTDFVLYDASDFIPELEVGNNVLAIHGMNHLTSSSDFLISVKLEALVGESNSGGIAGDVSPAAVECASGAQILLENNAVLKARALHPDNPYSVWSGLAVIRCDSDLPGSNLRVTELMYHPCDPNPDDSVEADDYEFVEIQNVGSVPIGLGGLCFTEGIRFAFPAVDLAVGEYALLAKDPDAFRSHYLTVPGDTLILGPYDGRLDNGGERLRWEDATGAVIQDFAYEDDWWPLTDGGGFSLTVPEPKGRDPNNWSLKKTWRPSLSLGGSPGWDDLLIPRLP